MIRYPRKIRNFNAFIDGVGYAGLATAAALPNLMLQVDRHRGAGMDGGTPIDMGQEDMQASVTLAQWMPELVKMLGRPDTTMTLRPTERSNAGDFEAAAFVCTIGGLWSGLEFANLEPGGTSQTITLNLAADYYRMVYQGDELCEIDFKAGKRVIGGTDQLAALRREMGV
ncbi:hypothetical protein SAMN05421853_102119 [Roseivivax halotolerans]|uniref:Phage major tail tube protein n=1 Tax=Roseivivax halotolerans TaxID=93684 RepID=A0A1I5W4B0_9RHOB|nr:phage major tail tube protein [Roseivivax halotolerans]SFQ14572.1 hypothetical protein SAMN05421853_102119 [Roseivivax halotolerans]